MVAALNAITRFNKIKNEKYNEKCIIENTNEDRVVFPNTTVIGALAKYISTENKNFQPMNANFGILPQLDEKIKDKKLRYKKMAERSLNWGRSFFLKVCPQFKKFKIKNDFLGMSLI